MAKLKNTLTISTALSICLMISGTFFSAISSEEEFKENTNNKRPFSKTETLEEDKISIKKQKNTLTFSQAFELCKDEKTLNEGLQAYKTIISTTNSYVGDRVKAAGELVKFLNDSNVNEETKNELGKQTIQFLKKTMRDTRIIFGNRTNCLQHLLNVPQQYLKKEEVVSFCLTFLMDSEESDIQEKIVNTFLKLSSGTDGFEFCLSLLEKFENPLHSMRALVVLLNNYKNFAKIYDYEGYPWANVQGETKDKINKITEIFLQGLSSMEKSTLSKTVKQAINIYLTLTPGDESIEFCLSCVKKIKNSSDLTNAFLHLLDQTPGEEMKKKIYNAVAENLLIILNNKFRSNNDLEMAVALLFKTIPGEEGVKNVLSFLKNVQDVPTYSKIVESFFSSDVIKDLSKETKLDLIEKILKIEKYLIPQCRDFFKKDFFNYNNFNLPIQTAVSISEFLLNAEYKKTDEPGIKLSLSLFDFFVNEVEQSKEMDISVDPSIYKVLAHLLLKMKSLENNEEMEHLFFVKNLDFKSSKIQEYKDEDGDIDLQNAVFNTAIRLAQHERINPSQKLKIFEILLPHLPIESKKWALTEVLKYSQNEKLNLIERLQAIEILLGDSDKKEEAKKIAIGFVDQIMDQDKCDNSIRDILFGSNNTNVTEVLIQHTLSLVKDINLDSRKRTKMAGLLFSCRNEEIKKIGVQEFLSLAQDSNVSPRQRFILATHILRSTYHETYVNEIADVLTSLMSIGDDDQVHQICALHLVKYLLESDPRRIEAENRLCDISSGERSSYFIHKKLLEKIKEDVDYKYDQKLQNGKKVFFGIDLLKEPLKAQKLPDIIFQDFQNLHTNYSKELELHKKNDSVLFSILKNTNWGLFKNQFSSLKYMKEGKNIDASVIKFMEIIEGIKNLPAKSEIEGELSPQSVAFSELLGQTYETCSTGEGHGIHALWNKLQGKKLNLEEFELAEQIKIFFRQLRTNIISEDTFINELTQGERKDEPMHQIKYISDVIGGPLGLQYEGEIIKRDPNGGCISLTLRSLSRQKILNKFFEKGTPDFFIESLKKFLNGLINLEFKSKKNVLFDKINKIGIKIEKENIGPGKLNYENTLTLLLTLGFLEDIKENMNIN